MSAIAAYRTAIQKILDDASKVRFSDDQTDQGLRQALSEYSRRRPLVATRNIDGAGESVIELPADFQPIHVTRVEYHDEDVTPQVEMMFYAFHQDSQWFLDLASQVITAAESIDITYTTTHFIDGLDAAAGTSVPEEDETLLQVGAAGYAALYRAVSRSESVNLQPDVNERLLSISSQFLRDFRNGLGKVPGTAFAQLPAIPTDTF